ncbi:MAG: sulfotransferase family protein [Chloroflexota bacterium]|nr:sulfotransferase family protein [Chloroflexota bacterium]
MAAQSGEASTAGGLQVIGAGFGRTGTLSLKAALEELGFGPCYHMVELLKRPAAITRWEAAARGEATDWRALFDGYRATVDWPACSFYEELMQAYPDAKVLLTTRDPESWFESASSTIYQIRRNIIARILFSPPFFFLIAALTGGRARIGRLAGTLIWDGTFHGRFEDKDYAIAVFNQHNEDVKKRVPPAKLLVYTVKEGWEPLCRFLGVEVPDTPFPHLNERANFLGTRMFRRRLR